MTQARARKLAWAFLWAANCGEPPEAIWDRLPERDAAKVEREYEIVVGMVRDRAGEDACRSAAPDRFGGCGDAPRKAPSDYRPCGGDAERKTVAGCLACPEEYGLGSGCPAVPGEE